MFNRLMPLAALSMLVLSLAGCGGAEDTKQAAQPAAAPAAKAEEEKAPVYEITKDDITSHEGWTSRTIGVLGAKIGDKTTSVEKGLGNVENTRTIPKTETDPGYYLTIYQKNGLFVYTAQLTGKARKMDIFDTFAKQIADEKLKKYFSIGDMKDAKNQKAARDIFGMEEGEPVSNDTLAADLGATSAQEYRYDTRGFRLIQLKLKGGKTLNVLELIEPPKKTT
jgi:hypothetical protein